MIRSLTWSFAALACAVALGDDALIKFAEINRLEADYQRSVAEIEADSAKRLGVAADERLNGYRTILQKVTKAGDVDKAIVIRERMKEYEEAAEAGRPLVQGRLKILSATYGVNQSWLDVTEKLAKQVGAKSSWRSEIRDEDWGDPAPNYAVGNTLVVRYSFRGVVGLKAEYQGRLMQLP